MKKQNIEDIFSSMEDFSSVPPPELWGQIEEKLDKPKKKKRAILWWSAAACLLLGLMLPSVLHFSSNGISNKNNGNLENNSVVVGDKKEDLNSKKPNAATESSSEKETPKNQSIVVEGTSSSKNNSGQTDNSQNSNNPTAVAHTDAKTKSSVKSVFSNPGSAIEKGNRNSVQEKAIATGKESTFKTNASNGSGKKTENQAVAEKTFNAGPTNGFHSNIQNHVLGTDKKAASKILAEKTFNAGKTNAFSNASKNQVSNSIFENQLNAKNNKSFASTSILNENGNEKGNAFQQNNETIVPSRELASNQKKDSKFNTVALSKQDSVQLAELENLEKGIAAAETKKDKEGKKISKAEKWAVEVFAGVANSENYKNDKTLGNVNDSKQGSTYGVKTKYKINKKWAVGSGFKINELGQSIANISYVSSNSNNQAFYNSNDYFNINPTSVAPQISTNSGYIFVSANTTNTLKQNGIETSSITSGKLDQSLRYVEMPLEVSYAVFSKNKASINLNTGGFVGKLISNNMALNGNSIGENVNANDFVYGSTLSSTIQYRVYKKTSVFVEPAMNYYLNPLENQSFNQFQWGLNFGLNVSF